MKKWVSLLMLSSRPSKISKHIQYNTLLTITTLVFMTPSALLASESLTTYQKTMLWIIFILAFGATIWSLYYWWYGDPIANLQTWELFNPDNGFPPCPLCWYARVFQYPILLLSWVWLYFHDKYVAMRYILPLAVLWLATNVINWFYELNILTKQWACSVWEIPCWVKYVEYFWFLTLPLMWAIIFVITIVCAVLFHYAKKHPWQQIKNQ